MHSELAAFLLQYMGKKPPLGPHPIPPDPSAHRGLENSEIPVVARVFFHIPDTMNYWTSFNSTHQAA